MEYFVWHWIILVIVTKLFNSLNFNDNRVLLICMVVSCSVLLLIIVKFNERKKVIMYS